MIDVEVIGLDIEAEGPSVLDVEELCALALASGGIEEGHVAVEFVEPERMAELNREHRGVDRATDVLSFPIDGKDASPGPRELGDVVICAPETEDVRVAVIHGALHLAGMDHERDQGEMLALQAELVRWVEP